MQVYPPSEISLHSSKKDCWLVIHGKVYDVTTFLEDHPGGEEVLLHASATGDATKSFEEVGHSSTATSMMEGYFLGAVEGFADGDGSAGGGPKTSEGSGSGGGSLKSKTLLEKKEPSPSASFGDILLPLLVLLLAFSAWYYLTYCNAKA